MLEVNTPSTVYQSVGSLFGTKDSDSCCPRFKPQQGTDNISLKPELTGMVVLVLIYSPSNHLCCID